MNRYTGFVFVPALLATSIFVCVSFEAQWVGEWNWTIDTITGATVLTGPLTAALGAHLAVAQRRLAPLTDTLAGGWRVPYRAWFQTVSISGGVYVLVGAGALVVTALNTPGGPFTWWELLIGFPVIGASAMVGISAGYWWPHRAVVLLVVPTLFLVGAFGPPPVSGLFRHGPEGGSLGGLRFDPAVVLPQAVALVALLVFLGALVLPWRDRGPHIGLVVASGVSLVLLVSSLAWADAAGSERLVPSDERADLCSEGTPRVCVAPSHRRDLSVTARNMRAAAAILEEGGVAVPATYEEEMPGYQPRADVGTFWLNGTSEDADDLRTGADYIMTPHNCPEWSDPAGPPPEQAYDARLLLVQWVVLQGGGTPSAWDDKASHWLDAARGHPRNQWVIETFEDLRSCDLESIRLPWSPDVP